jgi:dolichol-phosphate mannosyltransferase
MQKTLSLIVSVYNESLVLPIFFEELRKTINRLTCQTEIIFVNDGSTDNTLDILNTFSSLDERFKIISYFPNRGHENAMYEGIKKSKGETVICLDADLQHPPTLIPFIMQKRQEGFDVVLMVRIEREDGGWWKRYSSRLFYLIVNKCSKMRIEPNASDYFMISRQVVSDLMQSKPDKQCFLRGFIQLLPYPKTTLTFIAPKRVAGKSKYSFWKLLKFSISAIYAMKRFQEKTISMNIFTNGDI